MIEITLSPISNPPRQDPAGHTDQFGRGPAKRRPTQVVEAQPFLVATALVHSIGSLQQRVTSAPS
jgi:hypothetical protein